MRRALQDASPAEWCLWAETRGALADRVEHALRRRGERAAVSAPKGGDAHVSKGDRWALFAVRTLPGGGEEWGASCSDDAFGDGAPARRTAAEALRWVLGWP